MTVLSKQYSLIDLINLRLRDDDNYYEYRKSFNAVLNNNLVYNEYYKVAKAYPNMTWYEFTEHCLSLKMLGCEVRPYKKIFGF
tara:strand:- start:2024 stop:2272 length:249 start_codon:yes stop_codon:yes gene_type:complete